MDGSVLPVGPSGFQAAHPKVIQKSWRPDSKDGEIEAEKRAPKTLNRGLNVILISHHTGGCSMENPLMNGGFFPGKSVINGPFSSTPSLITGG